MKKLRIPTLFLATALQVMPMLRNVIPMQAQGIAPSVWAVILRLGASAAALGTYDSVSGATAVIFTMPSTNFTGTSGVPANFLLTITNYGNNAGAYFTNATGFLLPAGMNITTYDHYPDVHGNILGTPTTPTNNMKVKVSANYLDGVTLLTISTNINITILTASAIAPVITNQPVNQTVTVGSNATFSVTAGGTAPLAYQWRFNVSSNILGATNSSYTITNAQSIHIGNYTVVITNSAGSITSSPAATLTVNVPPGVSASPTNLTVTAGQPASFSVTAGGTAPLGYQWRKNVTNNIPGATGTNYTIANARLSDVGSFTVVITNAAGSITSSPVATLTVNSPPPPVAGPTVQLGGKFLFSFTPVVGLTNTVLTNGVASSVWNPLTNVPPPATTSSITVTDTVAGPARFYRVQIIP